MGIKTVNIPAVIFYHYCSGPVFKNIVEKKELWLTETKKMNDYTECSWVRSKLYELGKNQKGKQERAVIDELCRLYEDGMSKFDFFLCCLSREGDLLSQWRTYADDGAGFAVGVNINEIHSPLNMRPKGKRNWTLDIDIQSVNYDEKEQDSFFEDYIGGYLEKSLYPEPKCSATQILLDQLYEKTPIFKNPAFREEQEVRLIFNERKFKLAKGDTKAYPKALSKREYRITSKGVSPYYKYAINNRGICDIILGPRNESVPEDVASFLKVNKHKCFSGKNAPTLVRRSKATYRQ